MISKNKKDKVRPGHYKGRNKNFEAIDVIESYELNFNLGNVVKYLLRAGKKDNESLLEDLTKAAYYLQRELNKIQSESHVVTGHHPDYDPT